MVVLTNEFLLAERTQRFGTEFGTVYHRLFAEFLRVNALWMQYNGLYKDDETVNILANTAHNFFTLIQGPIFDDVVSSLAKLLGPVKSGRAKRKNATLKLFLEEINKEYCDKTLRMAIVAAVDKAECLSSRRNWKIAHFDYSNFLRPVPEVNVFYEDINELLRMIWDIFVIIEERYFEKSMIPELPNLEAGADYLVRLLEEKSLEESIKK